MIAAAICREMHWTWDEYLDQPLSFLQALTTMLKAESQHRNSGAK